ncbi:MAG: hypothetical protein JOZ31_14175 [Verrucomicrobia bacterium]|nr:hypothetical protein [Verrucomicrobiota bacterium]MBV8483809.1 hypothetical protein [Verrucomicrobiota bacterium]
MSGELMAVVYSWGNRVLGCVQPPRKVARPSKTDGIYGTNATYVTH